MAEARQVTLTTFLTADVVMPAQGAALQADRLPREEPAAETKRRPALEA